MNNRIYPFRRIAGALVAASGLGVAAVALVPPGGLVQTTRRDFQQPGSQTGSLTELIQPAVNCASCHGYYDDAVEPYSRWAGSMMAQATRDPIFHAALAIAEQDANDSGDLCLRCHAPGAWLAGRAFPTDGSALDQANFYDYDGVNCHTCHRLVDPVFDANESPPDDAAILAGLPLPPTREVHSGQYVVDPQDRRRGPFDLGGAFFFHEWRQSPFHRESLLCGTCHDVSNPALSLQSDGSYKANDLDEPHPTHDKRHEFPVERTYSEWSRSAFAQAEIDMGGRFGGDKPEVSTCQDCHMPDVFGTACQPGMGEYRPDLPRHDFNGANSWVLRAVDALFPQFDTGLTPQLIDAAIARNIKMLEDASDLTAFERAGELVVRIVNQSGHKLPTGYGEGRRMWINVKFFDAGNTLVAERGAYDSQTAVLVTSDTRVYEIAQGLDAHMSQVTGLPVGESFHFVLNNEIVKDNRIPPRGFQNAAFHEVGAPVVGHTYLDEHYWDDAAYAIPVGAVRAEVRLFHQTTTKEYIDFLVLENTTNTAGDVAKSVWEQFGKSAPVEMQLADVSLTAPTCTPPIPYGLGKVDSAGAYPELLWNGQPSVAAANFELEVSGGAPGEFGVVLFGDYARNSPLPGGGSLLIANPQRGATIALDANGAATVPIAVSAGMVGTDRYFQVLFRDPNLAARRGLTNGLHVDFCD